MTVACLTTSLPPPTKTRAPFLDAVSFQKHTAGGNKGFSFVCLDSKGVPGAGLTKAVALVLSLNARVRLEINREAKGVYKRADFAQDVDCLCLCEKQR